MKNAPLFVRTIAAGFSLAVGALSLLTPPAAPQEPVSARLQLLVTDSLGRPIEGAVVTVNGSRESKSTSAWGRLAVSASTRDSVNVLVRAVGFRSATLRVPAGWGSSGTFPVVLTRVAAQLPDLVVSGRNDVPAKYRGIARMEAFYDRKARGRGYFITREMMDRVMLPKVEDLLTQVPIRGLRSNLVFVRCSSRGEKVSVYINGARVITQNLREALLTIHPLDIEGIEVYRNISEIPPEFLADNCAAIVIWTRVN